MHAWASAAVHEKTHQHKRLQNRDQICLCTAMQARACLRSNQAGKCAFRHRFPAASFFLESLPGEGRSFGTSAVYSSRLAQPQAACGSAIGRSVQTKKWTNPGRISESSGSARPRRPLQTAVWMPRCHVCGCRCLHQTDWLMRWRRCSKRGDGGCCQCTTGMEKITTPARPDWVRLQRLVSPGMD